MIIYPYKKGLRSTASLRDEGCKIRYDTSRVRRGIATSWGNRSLPPWFDDVRWINHPLGIPMVANKLLWANTGLGPESTTSQEQAKEWASERGTKVMCRTLLNASGGKGIEVARNPDQVVDAPLYTKYFKKHREYRVIFSPLVGVVYAASKRLVADHDLDRNDLLIRTKDRGFVFQVEPIDSLPDDVAIELNRTGTQLESYGLKLLAYDVAYNTDTSTAMVIEANSAWGLNPTSAKATYDAMITIGENL